MKYRVECAAQELADLIADGMTRLRAEAQATKNNNLSDNERADMRTLYEEMING